MSYIKTIIETFFRKSGNILDLFLKKHNLLSLIACNFFFYTSKLTNFLLFNSIGYCLFLFSTLAYIDHYNIEIHTVYDAVKLLGIHKIFIVFLHMPYDFTFFTYLLISFNQIVVVNTFLAYTTVVPTYMKKRTNNNNIMVALHYNSGLSTLAKSSLLLASAVGAFGFREAMEAYKVKTIMEIWAASNGGNPTTPCPVNIAVVSTSTSTSNHSVADLVGTILEKRKG